ncbi:AfsR/SARP family transcriptional regulator [Streptomyces sp. NPDC001985]|uniref:AfsR/SARP family transcriptional regulator n=1 Tax=Streptomyces sp. NPDC001985 TaxID=3154406 RepID=UPI003328D9E7
MEAGVLGDLVLLDGRTNLLPSAPKPRQLLAFLLLNANHMVRAEDCIRELWGSEPPRSAMSTLQTYVLQIRQALRTSRTDLSESLVTRVQGYQLGIPPDDFDRTRFVDLAKQGRGEAAAGNAALAADLFTEALALWRGPALSDVRTGPMSTPHLVELEESRMGVLEQRIEAELALGRHRELLAELHSLSMLHPTHENIHAQLMVALYRSGQPTRAAGVYRRLRGVLGDSLGIAPVPRMKRLHQAIRAGSPSLEAPRPAPWRGGPGPVRSSEHH